MEFYTTPLKVSGHQLFLSERPPTTKNKPDFNEHSVSKFLQMLKQNNIETVVVLLTQRAMDQKYDGNLLDTYKKAGFKVLHFPISDFEVPKDMEEFHKLIGKISSALKSGNVLIHCGAGLGRTGTVAAGLAIYKGFKPHAAISMIRRIRSGSIETFEQEDFLKEYYPYAQMEESLI
jgi:protein-tyrosine phosphatase